jgi:hypothetical protein
MLRRCMELPPVSSLFEWHKFVDRSALLRTAFVDTAKLRRQIKNVVRLPSIYPMLISRASL